MLERQKRPLAESGPVRDDAVEAGGLITINLVPQQSGAAQKLEALSRFIGIKGDKVANAKVTLKLRNTTAAALEVVLEPWTGQYRMPPGVAFDVVAEGDLSLPLEVEILEGRVIVHCFDSEGADMNIFHNGEKVNQGWP